MRTYGRLGKLLGVLALALAAQPAAAVDLLSVYREAQGADTVYAAARATNAATQERLPQGLSGLLPVISVAGNTTLNDRDLQFRNNTPNQNARFNTNSLGVTATQPLFRYQNWITYEQAKNQVSQAEATFMLANQDLIIRVAQAYFDVLLAQNNVTLATAQKAALSEQYAQAKRNFEVGTATITDSNDAQARYDLSVSQEIAALNDLEIKRQALRPLIGRVPPELSKLSPRFVPELPVPNNMDQWVEQGVMTSLQVRIAQATLDIAAQDVTRNRGGHLPTLDAIASYTDAGAGSGIQGGVGLDTTTKALGLQLSIPLYQGGYVNSKVREALALQEKARQDLENARRSVALATRTAFLGVTSGMAQIKALEAALVSGQSSLDSSKLGQEVGVRTQVDVLNALQQLITTRRDYAQVIYNYAINVLRLKAAAGTLSDDDVAYVNQWLEK